MSLSTPGRGGRSPVTIAVALLYILLWSSAFIATKVGVTHSPPLTLLSTRFLCAAAILAVLARARGLAAPASLAAWGRLARFGLLNSALYLGFAYESLRHLSAGMATILSASNPLLLALVAPRLLGERLSPLRVLGLLCGFGGVVFVMGARLGRSGRIDTPLGMVLQVAGLLALVAATIDYKRRPPTEHPLVVNAGQLAAAGLALAPPALLGEGLPHIQLDAPLIWSFVYLVLVISIGASLLWFWLLARGEASIVSAYYFLTPIFGLALAALLLGESFGVRDLLGLTAVATGIALISRPTATATSPPIPVISTPKAEPAPAHDR